MATTIQPFPWRRLTPKSTVIYRLDEDGRLAVRGSSTSSPFDTARVRDGKGGFGDQPLSFLGFVWDDGTGDAWCLRTKGRPQTMADVSARWGALVRATCAHYPAVDERLVLVTIACESGNAKPDASGHVKAPRTETRYPRRTGESDPGDGERDAEDLRVNGGMRSSHGLMQTTIGTALAARPDLFKGVPPNRHRQVLWDPAKSIAIGVAHLASFPRAALADPLAARIKYASGSITESDGNRWGTKPLYDEVVPLRFLALWNDLAAVRALVGASSPIGRASVASLAKGPNTLALKVAFAGLVAASAVALGGALYLRHTAKEAAT